MWVDRGEAERAETVNDWNYRRGREKGRSVDVDDGPRLSRLFPADLCSHILARDNRNPARARAKSLLRPFLSGRPMIRLSISTWERPIGCCSDP